jgi:hypothetical protein
MPIRAVARATNTAPQKALRYLSQSLKIDTSKEALWRAGSIRAYRTNILSGILESCTDGVVGSWTDGPPTVLEGSGLRREFYHTLFRWHRSAGF